jgi:hypothetical protein
MELREDDVFVKGLKRVAPMMRKLDKDERGGFFFDAMTESVIWHDELPKPSDRGGENFWGLRPIFRYRSSVLMGSPEMEWEPYWQLAKSLFPCWVGFRAERLEPKEEIIKLRRNHQVF